MPFLAWGPALLRTGVSLASAFSLALAVLHLCTLTAAAGLSFRKRLPPPRGRSLAGVGFPGTFLLFWSWSSPRSFALATSAMAFPQPSSSSLLVGVVMLPSSHQHLLAALGSLELERLGPWTTTQRGRICWWPLCLGLHSSQGSELFGTTSSSRR